MAEQAETVIRDALQEIIVQATEQPIEPTEASDAIRLLNRMMAQWDARGMSLGYTQVSNLSDTLTVPDGALDGIVLNLAVKLARQYDVPAGQDLIQNAKDAMEAIYNLTIAVGPSPFQSTLPIGSGNEDSGWTWERFYNEETDDILAETTGNITQEAGNG